MVVYILIGDVANPGDDKGEFAYAGSATEVGKGYHRRLVEYATNHQLQVLPCSFSRLVQVLTASAPSS